MKQIVIQHGDVCLEKVDSIPVDVKKVKIVGNNFIIEKGEGVHTHELVSIGELCDKIEVYEKDGLMFENCQFYGCLRLSFIRALAAVADGGSRHFLLKILWIEGGIKAPVIRSQRQIQALPYPVFIFHTQVMALLALPVRIIDFPVRENLPIIEIETGELHVQQ